MQDFKVRYQAIVSGLIFAARHDPDRTTSGCCMSSVRHYRRHSDVSFIICAPHLIEGFTLVAKETFFHWKRLVWLKVNTTAHLLCFYLFSFSRVDILLSPFLVNPSFTLEMKWFLYFLCMPAVQCGSTTDNSIKASCQVSPQKWRKSPFPFEPVNYNICIFVHLLIFAFKSSP